jgi:uncharacterized protein (TIGR02145 family)
VEIVEFTSPSAISVKDHCFLISNAPKNEGRLLQLVSEHFESRAPNDTLAGYSYRCYKYYQETWFTRRDHKVSSGESFEDYLASSDELLIVASGDPRHNTYTATIHGLYYRTRGTIKIVRKIWKKECPLASGQDLKIVPRSIIETHSDVSAVDFEMEAVGDTMTDSRDGQRYRTMRIGGRVWMVENLGYHIANSWCYDHCESNCNKLGRLYDWNTAKKVCPNGWHLPSREEWKDFVVTAKEDDISDTHSTGGGYGLLAQQGGYYRFFDRHFEPMHGNWWTSTTDEGGLAYSIYTNSYFTSPIETIFCHICNGLSVRCVQDIANVSQASES